MPIGPQLPSQAEKRRRSEDDNSDASDDSIGPLPPNHKSASPSVKKARVIGPSLPDHIQKEGSKVTSKTEPKDDETSDDSEDDFGPSLPPPTGSKTEAEQRLTEERTTDSSTSTAPPKVQRDEWMTMAPTSGDWSQRIDPTKMKNRKFNTGRASTAASSGTDAWNETPEEKQARLKREVLGIKSKSGPKIASLPDAPSQDELETARRIKEYNSQRGPSLYAAHQKDKTIEEDDPSARAFDREKDIAGGLQINATKRREMMKKSSDFNSRFSSARYL